MAGLGLLSFITMFCDFILLNYVSERSIVSWVFSAILHSFSLILVPLIIFKPTSWTVIFSTMIWKSIRPLQLTKTQVKQRKFEVLDKQDIMQVMSLLLQYVNHIYTILLVFQLYRHQLQHPESYSIAICSIAIAIIMMVIGCH